MSLWKTLNESEENSQIWLLMMGMADDKNEVSRNRAF